MTGQGRSHGWTWAGIGPPTWDTGPANQNEFFLTKGSLLQTEILLSFISCPGGWSPQVKKPDVEFLGWCGYTRSAVVRPVGCTAKFSKTTELMVETLTLNYLATALEDIAAVSMPIARSLKT